MSNKSNIIVTTPVSSTGQIPVELNNDQIHNEAVDRIGVLRDFLSKVFEEAAARGLTKQDVLHAVIRHASIIGEPNLPASSLPDSAPELYAGRRDKKEDPVSFLKRVWGPYMELGVLYREDIERLGDIRLIPTLRVHCHRHDLDAESILPPSVRSRVDDIVATWAPDEREAARLWVGRQNHAKVRQTTKG